ncbi:6325_t:CDS:1, partial [Dentiscutata heterogama]
TTCLYNLQAVRHLASHLTRCPWVRPQQVVRLCFVIWLYSIDAGLRVYAVCRQLVTFANNSTRCPWVRPQQICAFFESQSFIISSDVERTMSRYCK